MKMAQAGQTGAAAQAGNAQLAADQQAAAGTAAAQMQQSNAQQAQAGQQNTLDTMLQAGDYTGANKILTQMGQSPIDFTAVETKTKNGDLMNASNDMLQLATTYAQTNPEIAGALTAQAMGLRGQVYSNIAGANWNPSAISQAATALSSGASSAYDNPTVKALTGYVVPSILSWFDSAQGTSSSYQLQNSPKAKQILSDISAGRDTTSSQDVQDLGYAMSLMFNQQNGVTLTAEQSKILSDWGLMNSSSTNAAGATGTTATAAPSNFSDSSSVKAFLSSSSGIPNTGSLLVGDGSLALKTAEGDNDYNATLKAIKADDSDKKTYQATGTADDLTAMQADITNNVATGSVANYAAKNIGKYIKGADGSYYLINGGSHTDKTFTNDGYDTINLTNVNTGEKVDIKTKNGQSSVNQQTSGDTGLQNLGEGAATAIDPISGTITLVRTIGGIYNWITGK